MSSLTTGAFGPWFEWDRKRKEMPCLIIKMVKVPAGPAPEKFREAWLGLELPAKGEAFAQPEVDFTTGEMVIRGKTYMVPKEAALKILEQKSPEAAQWFRIYFPPEMEHFTFGIDEVEVISRGN